MGFHAGICPVAAIAAAEGVAGNWGSCGQAGDAMGSKTHFYCYMKAPYKRQTPYLYTGYICDVRSALSITSTFTF